MSNISTLSLLRQLYRELRPTISMGQKHVYESPNWKYIVSATRASLNSANSAESQRLFSTGQKYLLYLQSTRQFLELQEKFKGHGERSADDLAHLMGFRMPNEPVLPRKVKSSEG